MQTLPPPLDLDFLFRAMIRRVAIIAVAMLISAVIAGAL